MSLFCSHQVVKFKAYSPADFNLRIIPTSSSKIRKMAEEVNHQEVHDLLIEIAHRAGEMIISANPLVSTTSTKQNCKFPLLILVMELKLSYGMQLRIWSLRPIKPSRNLSLESSRRSIRAMSMTPLVSVNLKSSSSVAL